MSLVYRVEAETMVAPGRWLVTFDVLDPVAGKVIVKGVQHAFQRLTGIGISPVRWSVVGAPVGSGFDDASTTPGSIGTGYTYLTTAPAYHELLVALILAVSAYKALPTVQAQATSTIPVGAFIDTTVAATPTVLAPPSLAGL